MRKTYQELRQDTLRADYYFSAAENNNLSTAYPVWKFGHFLVFFWELFFLQKICFKSRPGGNQVDGLPPASSDASSEVSSFLKSNDL